MPIGVLRGAPLFRSDRLHGEAANGSVVWRAYLVAAVCGGWGEGTCGGSAVEGDGADDVAADADTVDAGVVAGGAGVDESAAAG